MDGGDREKTSPAGMELPFVVIPAGALPFFADFAVSFLLSMPQRIRVLYGSLCLYISRYRLVNVL